MIADGAGQFRSRLDRLFATVEAVMEVLRIPSGGPDGATARARAHQACVRALGQLAWTTAIVAAIKAELDTDDTSEPARDAHDASAWGSHTASIH